MLQFVLCPTDYRGPVAGNCLGKGGAPATVCALGQIITNSPLGHFLILLLCVNTIPCLTDIQFTPQLCLLLLRGRCFCKDFMHAASA